MYDITMKVKTAQDVAEKMRKNKEAREEGKKNNPLVQQLQQKPAQDQHQREQAAKDALAHAGRDNTPIHQSGSFTQQHAVQGKGKRSINHELDFARRGLEELD